MIPLPLTVDVSTMIETVDPFNNKVKKPGAFTPVKVAGWAVRKVEEKQGDQILRTIDSLELYTPQPFDPAATIRLPDNTLWKVQGHSEDYRHGPFWDPGLYVVHAIQVTG